MMMIPQSLLLLLNNYEFHFIIMNFTQYNSTSRSSKNLFRERSISSLPTRQTSVMNIISQRQSQIFNDNKKMEQEKSVMLTKDNQISKLRKNLETAVSTALNQKLQNSKKKDELNQFTHLRKYLQGKIKLAQKDLKLQKENNAVMKIENEQLKQSIESINKNCKELERELKEKMIIIEKTKNLPQQMQKLKVQLKQIQPLKERIITLQAQVRQQKLLKKQAQQREKASQQQISLLQKHIALSKPRQQELRQRIVYLDRVNLDLSRKMQDYSRRQNDYIKQITSLKNNLLRVTSQRNYYKTVYEETLQKLQKKTIQYDDLTKQYNQKLEIIQMLQADLSAEKKTVLQLKEQVQGKNQYYKRQGEQNIALKQRNKLLQGQQLQLRKVIDSYLRIADQVNLNIVMSTQEIKKLKQINQNLKVTLNKTEEKFQQFTKLVEQGSEKGVNQIRDNFYTLIRAQNDLTALVKQQRIAFDQKVIVFAQERDSIMRNIEVRKFQLPTDETQFISIFQEKTESMLLMEKSNDQLLLVKKQLQNRIEDLQKELQKQRKEMTVLKLKTADLFRAKKQLQQARKSNLRYQQMIEQNKQTIDDLKSQVSVLRERNTDLNEKNFVVELDRRNLQVKVKEMGQIMKELNIQTLMIHKQINQKNTHLLTDSLQKLQSAIKSLAFYFHCAFCGELPSTPITLVLCGHTYCTKCKEAYSQSCYECDTGQPIEKVFQNRFLKDAGGKYKFITMVLAQLKANFNKKE